MANHQASLSWEGQPVSLQSRERVRLLEVRVRGLELQILRLARVVSELSEKRREASI